MDEPGTDAEFETVRAERMLTGRQPVYDVCAYGATGDGSTDDTAAIQAALDAADGEGGVVYLPGGNYYTTYTLLYGSDLMIYGPAATIEFEPSHEDSTALVSASFDGSVDTSRVTIQGLAVEAVEPEKGNGIGMAKAEDMAVKACQTHGLNWHLVDIAGAKNVLVADCYAANLPTAAYQADNLTSEGGLVVEHADGSTEGAVVDDTNNQNVDIEGNVAENCGRGVHFHRDGGHDLTVRGNKIRGCTDVGILGDANMHWHDVIVTGNIVEGNGESSGIHLQGEYTNLSVQNNTVRHHGKWGLAVRPNEDEPDSFPEGISIRNNTVERVAGTAIALKGSTGEIANNYVYDIAGGNTTTDTGSSGGTGTSDDRDGSDISDPGHVGVSIEDCGGVSVRNNVFRNVGGTGVVCRHGTVDVMVSGNDFDGFLWGIEVLAAESTRTRVNVEGNKIVGGPSSHGGIRIEGGRQYWVDNNAISGVGVGLSASDATDLRLTDNDAATEDGENHHEECVGYAIRDSRGVVACGNDAAGFVHPTVIAGVTSDVRAEVPHAGLRVGSECENVFARFEGHNPPESGSFATGSQVRNVAPAAGGHLGWVCVASGSPGVWKPFGRIEA